MPNGHQNQNRNRVHGSQSGGGSILEREKKGKKSKTHGSRVQKRINTSR
jgi:hypothetical protein